MKELLKSIYQRVLSGDRRTVLLRKNVLASILLKACTGIITLLLVPLTLRCLGEYGNGVWLTISSTLLWIESMDIGLGNGLRNKLSTYVAHGEWANARSAVSTTLMLLMLIVVPSMLLLLGLVQVCDVYAAFNVEESQITDFRNVLSISIILFCSTFIMKFIGNVYQGLQLPAISNFLVTGGHPVILLGTYLMYVNGIHSLMGIAVLNLSVPLLMYVLAYPYTFYYKYPLLRPSIGSFRISMSRQLLSLGVMFFVNQMASSIVFLSSNIIISSYFTPSAVTPYQVAYRYFSIIFLVFSIFNAPNWTATTDAYARGDIEWIRNAAKRMNMTLLLFLALAVLMVIVSPFAYSIWIGDSTHVSMPLTITMAAYIFAMIYSLAYCYFLNGLGILRLQLICTVSGVVIYFCVVPLLVSCFHDVIAISIGVTIALLPNAIVNHIQFHKVINQKAEGIWRK